MGALPQAETFRLSASYAVVSTVLAEIQNNVPCCLWPALRSILNVMVSSLFVGQSYTHPGFKSVLWASSTAWPEQFLQHCTVSQCSPAGKLWHGKFPKLYSS